MQHADTTILLCSDLDRTLLPNGSQPESPQARRLLQRAAQWPSLRLAYVTGRDEHLLRKAVEEYAIPLPAYAITDVGTRIYHIATAERWHPMAEWERQISGDWADETHRTLQNAVGDMSALRLQEPAKQNTFKLSYYVDLDADRDAVVREVERRLSDRAVRANIIWSVDEPARLGLLDILPASANKLHAVRFLMAHLHVSEDRAVFAGDSGNDLAVLTSGLQAVLVKNAAPDVRNEALQILHSRGLPPTCLYVAAGGFLGMNGNYAAGVLEGLAHFVPEAASWLDQAQSQPSGEQS